MPATPGWRLAGCLAVVHVWRVVRQYLLQPTTMLPNNPCCHARAPLLLAGSFEPACGKPKANTDFLGGDVPDSEGGTLFETGVKSMADCCQACKNVVRSAGSKTEEGGGRSGTEREAGWDWYC